MNSYIIYVTSYFITNGKIIASLRESLDISTESKTQMILISAMRKKVEGSLEGVIGGPTFRSYDLQLHSYPIAKHLIVLHM